MVLVSFIFLRHKPVIAIPCIGPPSLSPDQHWDNSRCRQNHQDPEKSKCPSVVSCVNKGLHRVGNRKIDQRRANG